VPEVAAEAAATFRAIEDAADEVKAVSDRGIQAIVEGYVRENNLCLTVGHSQPEEGSEHYFVYCLEAVVSHGFVHGEAVGLGAVLMAELQGNEPRRVVELLARCGVEWKASHLGVSAAQLETTLHGLPGFVRSAGLPYSVVDERLTETTDVARLVALAEP